MIDNLLIVTLTNGERIIGNSPPSEWDDLDIAMSNPMYVITGHAPEIFLERYFAGCKDIMIRKDTIATINTNIPIPLIDQYNIKLNYYEQVFDDVVIKALESQNNDLRSVITDDGQLNVSLYDVDVSVVN